MTIESIIILNSTMLLANLTVMFTVASQLLKEKRNNAKH